MYKYKRKILEISINEDEKQIIFTDMKFDDGIVYYFATANRRYNQQNTNNSHVFLNHTNLF